MKEKIKNLNIYSLYSLFFIIMFFIIFLPVSIRNLNIGFSGLFTDGFTQHVVFMRDYISKIKDWIINGTSFPMFDLNLGMGADVIASYGYYGLFDPFNIIAIILPLKWIEFSYYFILVIKMYLSGLFFIMFAKKILINNKWALVTSGLLYTFNSCMFLSTLRHGIFAGALMIFPLVLLGAYKVIKKEKPYILIFSTLYALLSQFYLYAYVAFGFEIFVLIKSYVSKNNKKEYFKNLIEVNLFFLLGTLLGSFVLFSELFAILNNGRTNGNIMINYDIGYYATLIFTYLLPTPALNYSNGIGNFFATILVILFFISIKKEKWLKVWLGVQLPLLLLSIFGYTLSLFSYVNNRWAFTLIVPICLIVAYSLEHIKEFNREKINFTLRLCSYLFVFALIMILNWLIINYLKIPTLYSILLRVIVTTLLLLVEYKIYKFDFNKLKIKKYDTFDVCKDFIKVNIILLFLFNIGMCFAFTDGYVVNKYYDNEFNSSMINDDSFYRVSKYAYAGNFKKHANDSIYGNYSSTFFYNTINNPKVLDLIEYFNINNENANVGYNGVGKRYILETISGVKYYISKDSEKRSAPYNFSYFDSYESIKLNDNDLNVIYDEFLKENGEYVKENNTIYVNNNPLPIAFSYDNYILKSDLDNLSYLERQVYLSKAVILDEYNGAAAKYTNNHSDYVKDLPYDIVNLSNITMKSNQFVVTSKDNYIEIKVTNLANSELYVELDGVKNENSFNKTIINYTSDDEDWIETIYNYGENFYIENEDQLLYMGYDENTNERTIKISFQSVGTYNYKSLNLYSLSMEDMIDDINNLSSKSLNDIVISSNNIRGNITLTNDSILFLSIPYNKGFKAYVNGKEVPIFISNIAYMGVSLNEGYNEIEFRYETPCLSTGFKVSIIAFSVFIAYSLIDLSIYIYKKKKAIN